MQPQQLHELYHCSHHMESWFYYYSVLPELQILHARRLERCRYVRHCRPWTFFLHFALRQRFHRHSHRLIDRQLIEGEESSVESRQRVSVDWRNHHRWDARRRKWKLPDRELQLVISCINGVVIFRWFRRLPLRLTNVEPDGDRKISRHWIHHREKVGDLRHCCRNSCRCRSVLVKNTTNNPILL